MNIYLRSLSFFGFLLLSSTHVALAQDADTILKNGSILTVDDAFSTAESLAILDGRIIAVGTNADVAQHLGVNTAVIELDGKTVVPGLIDNHFHFVRSVWNYQYEVSWIVLALAPPHLMPSPKRPHILRPAIGLSRSEDGHRSSFWTITVRLP